jgi:hypothetical protein
MTKLISKLAPGVNLKASALTPGTLSDLKMEPTDLRVQAETAINVYFKTQHDLDAGAGVQVKLPFGLSIPGFNDQAGF